MWANAPLCSLQSHTGPRDGSQAGPQEGKTGEPLSSLLPSPHRPFPSEETTENDDDVYRSLEELAE
jgi:hypothetical protein